MSNQSRTTPAWRKSIASAAVALMAMTSTVLLSGAAQAEGVGEIGVWGGRLELESSQVMPCLRYTLTYASLATGPSGPRMYVTSAATGKTIDTRESFPNYADQVGVPYGQKSLDYCVPLTADTDDLVFSLRTPEGSIVAESDPQHVSLLPASDATVSVLSAEIYMATFSGVVERQVVCLELGEALPGNEIFESTVPDATLACDEADYIERRAKFIRLLATTGVVAVATSIYTTWLLHWRDPAPGTTPTPDPTDPTPDPGPITPDPDLRVLERIQIIERIQTQEASLSDSEAESAADQCMATEVALAATASYAGSDRPCLSYALFFPGVDAGGAAIHDAEAISLRPEWAQLTYMRGKDKKASGVTREWYNAKQFYLGHCTKPGFREAKGVDCDEYPFYTTVEGGPGASLRDVPYLENRAEGRALLGMQRDAQCEMERDSTGALTYPGSGSKQFLVIPVAVQKSAAKKTKPATYSGLPSFHVCGDERSISIGGGGGSGEGEAT